jgi:Tfp pilus assembly protein PilZ
MDERREHERIKVTMSVSMKDDRAEVIWATMEDLSLGGAFIKTSRSFAIGTPVEIVALAPGNPGVAFRAVVCRLADRGLGVKWGEMNERERTFLAGVLAAIEAP